MIEITENNYKCIKCNGVIIGVPKSENLGYKFSIYFECASRSDGKHGYPKQGMWFTGDSKNFYAIAYDMDYYLKNGFYFDSSSRTSWTNCFNFDKVRYYQFKDFKEFCIWYLQCNYYKISQTKIEGEECVPKVIPVNTEEQTCPKHSSMENKKKIKRKDKYKDILEIIEMNNKVNNEIYTNMVGGQLYHPDQARIKRYLEEYTNFLEEEVDE